MKVASRLVAVGGVAALLLSACGGEPSAPAPSSPVSTVEAELLAAQMAGDFLGTSSATAMGSDRIAMGAPGYGFGTMSMPHMDGRGSTFTITRTVSFFDASGAPQSAYDALLTARVLTESSVAGTFTHQHDGGTHTMSVAHSGSLAVSGLAGTETRRTLDGAATGRVTSTGSTPRGNIALEVRSADSVLALVVPVPVAGSTSPLLPLSGSVVHVRRVSGTLGGQPIRPMDLKETTTFDGTGIARVTVVVNGVTRTCTRDLVARTFQCS